MAMRIKGLAMPRVEKLRPLYAQAAACRRQADGQGAVRTCRDTPQGSHRRRLAPSAGWPCAGDSEESSAEEVSSADSQLVPNVRHREVDVEFCDFMLALALQEEEEEQAACVSAGSRKGGSAGCPEAHDTSTGTQSSPSNRGFEGDLSSSSSSSSQCPRAHARFDVAAGHPDQTQDSSAWSSFQSVGTQLLVDNSADEGWHCSVGSGDDTEGSSTRLTPSASSSQPWKGRRLPLSASAKEEVGRHHRTGGGAEAMAEDVSPASFSSSLSSSQMWQPAQGADRS